MAEVNSAGDLYVDDDSSRELSALFEESMTEDFALTISAQLAASIDALDDRLPGSAASPENPLPHLVELGNALTQVVTFAILGKFLAGTIFDVLKQRNNIDMPPFPSPSPGAELASDLQDLADWCDVRGYPAGHLAARWPDVEPAVFDRVNRFSDEHVGFGPVAWEVPGYDDPGFVVSTLVAGTSPHRRPKLVRFTTPGRGSVKPEDEALYGALEKWLLLMEVGIILLRRTFHHRIIPLVGPACQDLGLPRSALPFIRFEEIEGQIPSISEIEGRRDRYRGASVYLYDNRLDPARIDRLVEAPL